MGFADTSDLENMTTQMKIFQGNVAVMRQMINNRKVATDLIKEELTKEFKKNFQTLDTDQNKKLGDMSFMNRRIVGAVRKKLQEWSSSW